MTANLAGFYACSDGRLPCRLWKVIDFFYLPVKGLESCKTTTILLPDNKRLKSQVKYFENQRTYLSALLFAM